jgi:hypothetical protein
MTVVSLSSHGNGNRSSFRKVVFSSYFEFRTKDNVHKSSDITNTILDVIHRPVFYLKRDVSDNGFCLRLQVEPTQFGPTGQETRE